MDVGFVKTVILSAVHVLKVQCSREFKAGKVSRRDEADLSNIDIAGVLGLSSESFNGSISLQFPEPTFLYVMAGMLGEEFTEITPDLKDGAGELLNIIFGDAKRKLNDAGHRLEKAIPTVICGKDLKVSHKSAQPGAVVAFTSDGGDFYIEIVIET